MSRRMGGFSRARLPVCSIPSVCLLIRVLRKLSLIVYDGVVEAIRDTEMGVCNGNVQLKMSSTVFSLFLLLTKERISLC